MDELQFEEQRQIMLDMKQALIDFKDVLSEKIDIEVNQPDKIKVTGDVSIVNPQKEIEISNISEITKKLDDFMSRLDDTIANMPEMPKSIELSNVPSEISINNWNELKNEFKALKTAFQNNRPIVNTEKQIIKFPNTAREYVSVRLTDGKQFYDAKQQPVNVSGGGGETDPLVGYQPADIDETTAIKYYGFVKKNGYWYIMKNDSGAIRYAVGAPQPNGGGLYSDAWTDKANLNYGYFYEVF